MSKYYVLGTFIALASWSSSYISPTAQMTGGWQSGWQIGSAASAEVRWTPNPDRGSASSTLSGGRRSASSSACTLNAPKSAPAITLLVPNRDAGLTTTAQSTLSWYLESKNTVDMEFMLSHPDKAEPVYTQKLQASTGLVEVALPPAALEMGKRYRWTVFVNCSSGGNQIHTRSFVERVPADGVAMVKESNSAIALADAYAVSEIWYDTLNTLISAYREDPEIDTLLEICELLAQAQTNVPLDLSLAVE